MLIKAVTHRARISEGKMTGRYLAHGVCVSLHCTTCSYMFRSLDLGFVVQLLS